MIIGIKKYIVQAVVLCVIMLLGTYSGYAQIRKTFTPRISTQAPGEYRGVTNYNLQGDFKMIGNTNMTTVSRSGVEEVNAIVMRYVDIDNDANTINSSSSTLALDNPDCAEIIYAGLYWTGRSHDIDNVSTSPNTFSVQQHANAQWYSVGHNENLGSGTLMTISRQGSGSNRYPRYTFTLPSGTVIFEYTNSTTNSQLRYSTNNGISWTNVGNNGLSLATGTNAGTVTGNQSVIGLHTPVTIGNYEFHQFARYSPTNGSEADYRSITHNAAKVRVRSGATTPKSLNKQQIKLKMGASNSYTTITANSTDIHYPATADGAMYAAYADVTNYVRTNGAGEYFVADMALQEGFGGPTGYYGGWGMVIVYKDVSKRWRDITVFDGFGYMTSDGSTVNLDVSGFRAVQNGAVNVTLGMMAGEGDREISGDFFRIRNRANNSSYTTLTHSGNSPTDFFNSSVVTGGNPRNPNYVNNTGLDIARFDLTNNGNSIINNNQTSTRFQFGTSGDTYSIFNIVFAVDAYVPEVIVENGPAAGSSVSHQGLVLPGQEYEFQLDLFNKGTEAVNGLTVDIPIPFNMHYVENGETITPGSHSTIKIANNTTVQWIPPTHAPSGASPDDYAGGTLRWNVGALPLDPNRNVLQGTLKYKFRVTDNCALLTTGGSCGLDIKINGTISGTGATSGTAVSAQLVQAGGSSPCGDVIFDDFESTILVSEQFTANCQPPPIEDGMLQFVAFCSKPSNVFTRAEITDFYPKGTKFFTQEPTDYNTTAGLITGDFPVTLDGAKTTYWAVAPGMDPGCFMRLQTSVTLVTTVPVPTPQHATACFGEDVELNVTLSATGVSNGYQLFYFDNESSNTPLAAQPTPTAIGLYSFWVAEGVMVNGVLCIGPKVEFTITIYEGPTASQDTADVSICENSDTQFTVTTSGATSYAWEYTTAAAPTVWLTLDNNTFNGQITLTNNTMSVSHAMRVGTNSIDGIKVRLKAINSNGCEAYSNEIAIEVKDCRAITNPMLPSKANK